VSRWTSSSGVHVTKYLLGCLSGHIDYAGSSATCVVLTLLLILSRFLQTRNDDRTLSPPLRLPLLPLPLSLWYTTVPNNDNELHPYKCSGSRLRRDIMSVSIPQAILFQVSNGSLYQRVPSQYSQLLLIPLPPPNPAGSNSTMSLPPSCIG
jgi:hypothetical protein